MSAHPSNVNELISMPSVAKLPPLSFFSSFLGVSRTRDTVSVAIEAIALMSVDLPT